MSKPLKKLFDPRSNIEDKLKESVSENVINQGHENVYKPIKQPILSISSAIDTNKSLELERQLTELRITLDKNPKEREMQKRLLELEHHANMITASLSEVSVKKPSGRPGRIDILACPSEHSALGRIIELKRPSLKLVVLRGTPRVSKPLKRAIKQVGEYQESDLTFHDRDGELADMQLTDLRKTIVAGRKYSLPGSYLLIAKEENVASVDIYSWDAWIDRFERIHT